MTSNIIVQTKSKLMILVAVILMDILAGAEVDLFVPSFPELKAQFDVSPFWLEMLLSSNFIGYCLSLFWIGGFADRFGRKPVIISGLLIFIIGSLLCLFATSFIELVIGRFLQGIGVASPAILCFLIVSDLYPIKEQQKLTAILNGVSNASVGAAPLAGSYISLYFHWQGNFTSLLLLALLVFIITLFFVPNIKPKFEDKTKELLGYKPIFKSKLLMLIIITIVFINVPYWVFIGISPLLFIESLGVKLEYFGFYQGAWAFLFAVGSLIAGFIIDKYDRIRLFFISSLICLFGLICISLVTLVNCKDPLLITLAFIPFNIGTIIPVSMLYPLCYNFIPEIKGRISATIQGIRLIFTSIGLQLAGFYYDKSFQNIGIILSICTLIGVIGLFLIFNNRKVFKT